MTPEMPVGDGSRDNKETEKVDASEGVVPNQYETILSEFGEDYKDLARTLENIDGALASLESQSDSLFNEMKEFLEENKSENREKESQQVPSEKETEKEPETS